MGRTALPCLPYFEQYCARLFVLVGAPLLESVFCWVMQANKIRWPFISAAKIAPLRLIAESCSVDGCRWKFIALSDSHDLVSKKMGERCADHAEKIKREYARAICATAYRGSFSFHCTIHFQHLILYGQFEIFATQKGALSLHYSALGGSV